MADTQDINTEQDISNAVLRFFASVDAQDWSQTAASMTAPFQLDYSSFGAGPAAALDPSDIVTGWRSILPGFDFTHHQLGPLDISVAGDAAVVASDVTATHFVDGETNGSIWTVFGRYTVEVAKDDTGWRLSGLTFHFKFQTGNLELPSIAQERASR